jgi:hypothetical protein
MNKFLFTLTITFLLSGSSFASTQIKEYKLPSQTRMVQLSLTAGMASELDLQLAVDTSTTPAKLKGKYQSLTDDGSVKQSCQFTGQLTATEAQNIRAQLQKIRYCESKGDEDMVMDPEYLESLYVYIEKPVSGNASRGADIKKYSLVGWGPQKYICKGGADLYRLMKSISSKRAPQSCPQNSSRLFTYQPNLNH